MSGHTELVSTPAPGETGNSPSSKPTCLPPRICFQMFCIVSDFLISPQCCRKYATCTWAVSWGFLAKTHLADVVERRAETREHLCRDVQGRELAADVLECAHLERRQIQLVREAVHRLGGHRARPRRTLTLAHAPLQKPLRDPLAPRPRFLVGGHLCATVHDCAPRTVPERRRQWRKVDRVGVKLGSAVFVSQVAYPVEDRPPCTPRSVFDDDSRLLRSDDSGLIALAQPLAR